MYIYIYMGKLQEFTNQKFAAIVGMIPVRSIYGGCLRRGGTPSSMDRMVHGTSRPKMDFYEG